MASGEGERRQHPAAGAPNARRFTGVPLERRASRRARIVPPANVVDVDGVSVDDRGVHRLPRHRPHAHAKGGPDQKGQPPLPSEPLDPM